MHIKHLEQSLFAEFMLLMLLLPMCQLKNPDLQAAQTATHSDENSPTDCVVSLESARTLLESSLCLLSV